jgi:hypothetical protein
MRHALIPLSALILASCATIPPERCERAAAGLDTAAQITEVLIARGIEPVKAQKLADAVVTGQMLLAVACGQG